jgi:hypothetical protein
MLQHLCRQLKEVMQIDFGEKVIRLKIDESQEIKILTPKMEEWPVQFIQVDAKNSKLLRHFAETD